MKALALAAAVSLTFSLAAFAQDSKLSLKPNGAAKQPAEAAANIDVAAIQKKIDEFSEGIKNQPTKDVYYAARGQGYERLGKYDLAVSDLSKAISLNPANQAYLQIRAGLFSKQKKYRESFSDYSRALECGPKSHYLVLKQGQNAALAHDYKSALNSARLAETLKKDDAETLVLLGGAEQMNGLYQESLKHLSKALEINPSDRGAMEMRANTYLKLGKSDLARADFEHAKVLGTRP